MAGATPPLVLVEKSANALRLSAVDRTASALGLTVGQPLANARAMLPELTVVEADRPADVRLLSRIADWCDRFTPSVAVDGPRCLLLDVTGATHLFGGEQMMLERIRQGLQAQGFAVRGAMAGTAVAARAFARYRDGAVIAAGEEATAIAPLPVAALQLDAVTHHALRRAGLKTVGQMASRKRSELTARLGAGTLAILDEALGRSARPITPRQPLPNYWREQPFAEPLFMEDAILAALTALAAALAALMEQHGQGARRLETVFFRSDGAVRRVAIELGQPTRDPAIITRLFRERLAAVSDPLDPGFGFDLIRLCASRVERLDASSGGFDDAAGAERDVRFLIDRLSARLGSHRIRSFQPQDTHIPENAWRSLPAQHAKPAIVDWRKIRRERDAPRRPLRVFPAPELADLTSCEQILWRRRQSAVAQSEGPERIAMEWWRAESPQATRDYFRIEDSEGRRYWIYRNNSTAKWLLQGMFA